MQAVRISAASRNCCLADILTRMAGTLQWSSKAVKKVCERAFKNLVSTCDSSTILWLVAPCALMESLIYTFTPLWLILKAEHHNPLTPEEAERSSYYLKFLYTYCRSIRRSGSKVRMATSEQESACRGPRANSYRTSCEYDQCETSLRCVRKIRQ